ncbi:hypothetical protein RIF29_00881 [Crotalaria pallida]|uniref:Uncharacterized protein n=1 Tax=Crotalaria pallida TaxID=3830 RepID=A0AAN9P6V8_CROPI
MRHRNGIITRSWFPFGFGFGFLGFQTDYDGSGDRAEQQGGRRLHSRAANRSRFFLGGVARKAQGSRNRSGDKGDRYASP